jgi:hypothetical protein
VNTRTNESLSEDDGDDEKQSKVEYVAVEQDPESSREQHADDDHDDDDGDERLNADNEDREQIRQRRREEKAERAQRRKAAIERERQEKQELMRMNQELAQRVKNLEYRQQTQAYAGIESQIREMAEEVKAAEYIIGQAVTAGNGEDVTRAMRIRDEAAERLRQLQVAKMRTTQQPQQQRQQPQQQPDSPSLRMAKEWAEENDWFDPQGGDERSRQMLKIDQDLVNEGYNPDTLKYWRELESRQADLSGKKTKGGPPLGSGREHVSSGNRNEVYISPERVEALKQLGVYGDKAAMAPYLKSFAKWDRENKSTR